MRHINTASLNLEQDEFNAQVLRQLEVLSDAVYGQAPDPESPYVRLDGGNDVTQPDWSRDIGVVEEAPVDGVQYARKDGAWSESSGGVEEAPIDGAQYARQDGDWTEVSGGVEEAPVDGAQYARQDGGWSEVQSGGGSPLLAAIDSRTGDWDGTIASFVAPSAAATKHPHSFQITIEFYTYPDRDYTPNFTRAGTINIHGVFYDMNGEDGNPRYNCHMASGHRRSDASARNWEILSRSSVLDTYPFHFFADRLNCIEEDDLTMWIELAYNGDIFGTPQLDVRGDFLEIPYPELFWITRAAVGTAYYE